MKINKLIDKCIEDDVDIAKVHIDVLYEYAKDYNKLQQKNKHLKEIINNALEYIDWHYDLGTKENVEFCLLRDRLLEILGDKECIE